MLLFTLYFPFCALVLFKYQFLLRFTYLFPLLLPLFLLTVPKKMKAVRDWSIFYLIAFFYDLFRGFIPRLNSNVNPILLAQWEGKVFGEPIPTIYLQERFEPYLEGFLGTILTGFYMTHFILPIVVLYFLWKKNRKEYFFAVACLLLVSSLAFVTFLVFPASPPWHASLASVVPEIKQYLLTNMNKIFNTNLLSDLYRSLNSNPYAPFPSLHAAYPMLLALISLKFFKGYFLFFLCIALIVPFALVSFGEHYVVDIIAGWGYALLSFCVVNNIYRLYQLPKRVPHSPPQSKP